MLKRSKEKSSTKDERSGLELASAVVMRPSLKLAKTQQNDLRTTIGRHCRTKHSADILLSSSSARCFCSPFHFYLTLLTSSFHRSLVTNPSLFLAPHGTASSFLPTVITSAEHDNSWSLLPECVTRFCRGKLLFHWRLVPLDPNRRSSLPFVNLHWRPAQTVQPPHLFLFPALDLWWRKPAYFLILLSHSICTALNLSLRRGFSVETRRNQPRWWWSHHWPSASFPTAWELPDEPASNTSLCMGNRDWKSSDIFMGRCVIQGPLRWLQKSSCSACKAAHVDCGPARPGTSLTLVSSEREKWHD